MTTRRLAAVCATTTLAAALLAACGTDSTTTSSPTSGDSSGSSASTQEPSATTGSSSAPAATPTPTAPPAGFALKRVTSRTFPDADGRIGIGRAVRVGHHTGFDRVVYELTGTGRPAYRVGYVDHPVGNPSGEPVKVAGAAFLEVVVAGTSYVDGPAKGPKQVPKAGLAGTVIAQSGVVYAGFEGQDQTFIGVTDRKRAFRVTTLTTPTRLVVDVLR